MTPIPMPLRAAAGLAAVAIDEARRLPNRVVGLPVLAMGTVLQVSLKAQQRYAELVTRGDQLLGQLRSTEPGAPAWARFDEDEVPGARPPSAFDTATVPADLDDETDLAEEADAADADDVADVDDLLDLDEVEDPDELADLAELDGLAGAITVPAGPAVEEVEAAAAGLDDGPAALPLAGYDGMSIPQLRARLRTLTERQLVELVDYEQATARRPAYLTMLANRLATVRGR